MTKKLFYKNKIQFNIFFLLGICLSFSLPPYNFFIISFIVFPTLIFLLKKNINKREINFFYYGLFFGFGYFAFSLYWISYSLNFDPNVFILKPFALILLPLALSFFYGVPFYLLKKFFSFDRFFIFSFAILMSLSEYFRFYITGFSWNLFAYSLSGQIESIQILNLVGTFGLNFLCIIVFSFPILFLENNKKKLFFKIIVFLLIIILNYTYGSIRLDTKLHEKKQDILIVQPNENLQNIYNFQNQYIEDLIKLSEPKKRSANTIFLWPEGSYSFLQDNNFNQVISRHFYGDQKIILGGNINEEDKIYNAFLVYSSKGKLENTYKKIHLVPFGEYIPFENFLQKFNLKKVTFGYKSFSEGTKRDIIKVNSNKILPLICYEIIDTGLINLSKNDYEVIFNISEDAWFNRSVGSHQHFVHSIFRSIEEGKHIFRSTNQGISSSINPLGQVIYKSELNEKSFYVGSFSTLNKKTIFSVLGNLMFFLLVFITILIRLFSRKYFKI